MKIAARFAAAMLCILLLPMRVDVCALSVSAKAAVLLCAETGEVLYALHAQDRLSMASTTKIMTALLTLEACAPLRTVCVSEEMTAVEGTSMGLLPGDTVTLYGLACGMLLSSGNDAANAAAIALSGSIHAFAEKMNRRAFEIGMHDTHFVTPSGLDDEAHYSTALDMALLARAALRNPVFRRICSSSSLSISYGNPPYRRSLANHNRLLQSYPGCIGVKTGFTKKSGRCLVSAAQRDGVTLIAVTLSDPDDWFDHAAMLDYGFETVHRQELDADLTDVLLPVVGGSSSTCALRFAYEPTAVSDARGGEIIRQLYLEHFAYAPVSAESIAGRAVYLCNGEIVCDVPLVAAQDIPSYVRSVAQPKQSVFQRWMHKLKGVF